MRAAFVIAVLFLAGCASHAQKARPAIESLRASVPSAPVIRYVRPALPPVPYDVFSPCRPTGNILHTHQRPTPFEYQRQINLMRSDFLNCSSRNDEKAAWLKRILGDVRNN
ncbi:MAG: hypothetical protein PF501_19020 [Salinisphaera sp.]|jgi:hypothetical protein|nr:hypothetical protein [Salinisphaera sp.]